MIKTPRGFETDRPVTMSWFAFLRLSRALTKHLSALGITPMHALTLFLLSREQGPIPTSELRTNLGIGQKSITRLALFLHDRHMAIRTSVLEGKSYCEYLEITEHGRMVLEVSMKFEQIAGKEAFAGLSPSDATKAMRLLRTIAMACIPDPRKKAEVVALPSARLRAVE